MKKYVCMIILGLLLFVYWDNIYANNSNIFIKGETLDNQFIKKEINGNVSYEQIQILYRKIDNKIAYILQPNRSFVENKIYELPYDYSEESKYAHLSEKEMSLIKRIAYFGYGYGERTDSKWYAITQMLIWKTMYPNYKFEWTDDYMGPVISKYKEEENYLLSIALNSLNGLKINDVSIQISKTVKIKDASNLLNSYVIKNDDGLNVNIEGNNLILNANTLGKYQIYLKGNKRVYNSTVMVYMDSQSADLLYVGNINFGDYYINVNVYGGSLSIEKEEDSPSLIGNEYDLYKDSIFYKEIKITNDDNMLINDLEFGTYCILQKKALIGHLLDNKMYCVELNKDNLEPNLKLKTNPIVKSVIINKTYGSLNELNPEINVEFCIYKNDKLVDKIYTNNKGQAEILLEYGNYVFVQSSVNYEPSVKEFNVVIDENTQDILTFNLADYEVKLPNAGISNKTPVIICVILFVVIFVFYLKTYEIS